MEWDIYKLGKIDDFAYEFYSEGAKGKIRKLVRFQYSIDLGKNVFNLAFGDFDEATGRMNDKVVSNNGDQLKILHTVASVIIEFLGSRPYAFILIKGNTSSRTRLYQMSIAGFLTQVSQQFEILGELEKAWQPFQNGANYKRFLVYKKME